MFLSKKAAALAVGFIATLSVATVAQNPHPVARSAETLVIEDATVDWIEKSDVAALREGVIDRMELQIGMPVQASKPIGYLHSEIAELTVRKAELAVKNVATEEKAQAQQELALTVVATNKRLNERRPGLVSNEEHAQGRGRGEGRHRDDQRGRREARDGPGRRWPWHGGRWTNTQSRPRSTGSSSNG